MRQRFPLIRTLLLFVAVALVVVLALGVLGPRKPFWAGLQKAPFQFSNEGKQLPVLQKPSRSGAQDDSFLPGREPRETPRYSFNSDPGVPRPGLAFYLKYAASGEGLRLELSTRQDEEPGSTAPHGTMEVGLPSSQREIEMMVPLEPGTVIDGFQVVGGASSAKLAIHDAGIAPEVNGIVIAPDLLTMRSDLEYSPGPDVQSFSFDAITNGYLAEQRGAQIQVAVGYTYADDAGIGTDRAAEAKLSVRGAGGSRSFRVDAEPGSHTLYLYSADCGFAPLELSVSPDNSGFAVTSVLVSALPAGPQSGLAPIPADFGAMLLYDPAAWRTKEFELYCWNLIPDVLVLDFKDYIVQSRFMSRLAFFIEKKGYAGRLLTNGDMAGLHGWNAHDYRPEDLARFFQKADEQGFTLNPEENELRDLLAANGIIAKSGSAWVPGKGAIITVSQTSYYVLRYLLLTHEGYHGIYFTNPQYRADIASIWSGLSPAEQSFWRLFLGSRDYNSNDDYLVVNEFQAYLMQQRLGDVNSYYRNQVIRELETDYPRERESLVKLMRDDPSMFQATAQKVDDSVFRDAGVRAGRLVSLIPDQNE